MKPTFDVVICTFNNASTLDGALDSLARQRGTDPTRWSCLVVDNNCTDQTQKVVATYRDRGLIPGLRIVRETEQGLTPARRCGVRSTTAPWIAFVDDDCMLDPDWIAEAMAFAQTHPAAGAFGGKVILEFVAEPRRYVRNYGYLFAEQDRGDRADKTPFLVGAGLVVSRAALRACGWSEAPLLDDRVGHRLVSGGDVEIVLRIASAGYDLWYLPSCELRHRIPARRTSLRYLTAINRGLGVSQALADALVWDGTDRAWAATSVRKLARDVTPLIRLAASVVSGRRAAAEIPIQASFSWGQIVGVSRVLRMSRARRRMLMGLARRITRRSPAPTGAI